MLRGGSVCLSVTHRPGWPQVGYLFDHPGTVFFSIFMSFWAVSFLEYWKRKNATLAHHWDCMDFQEEEASGGRILANAIIGAHWL